MTRTSGVASLASDIGRMIESARQQVAQAANAALTALYWEIGKRIRQDVLRERRAEYGSEIVAAVGRQLEEQYGARLRRGQPSPDDPICRSVPGPRDSRIADTGIDVDPLHRPHPAEGAAGSGARPARSPGAKTMSAPLAGRLPLGVASRNTQRGDTFLNRHPDHLEVVNPGRRPHGVTP